MASRTLHVLGVPHTVAHDDYAVCAFTTKILNFPAVIQPFGWSVVEYGNEGSASAADAHVTVLTRERFRGLSLRRSREEALDADVNNTALQEEFQRVLLERVRARARDGDIVCHVWGPNVEVYQALPGCHHVELSVGYTASPGLPFRIYESSAWMHWHHGKAGREDGSHYQWVIPSALSGTGWSHHGRPEDYLIYLGRITQRKGMNELVEIARRRPDLVIRAYGPGDSAAWAGLLNLQFMGPVFGEERVRVVQRARCMLMPTVFIEPFGNAGVEAQLCGVPLVASSYGAFQETVVEGVTGYRCHTLADWCEAIDLSRTLDRERIAALARAKYGRETVGRQFDWALRQLADLSGQGWYGGVSRKFGGRALAAAPAGAKRPRIWLYMPYFGTLPNYFQLYLDSLALNGDHLSVVLLTDCDVAGYRLPENLVVVPMTFPEVKRRAAALLRREFDVDLTPDMILESLYKLCDFKILYPEMFFDIGETLGIGPDDLVGWGDCDLIYGRFADFLDDVGAYDLVGGYHGHLTAMRNTVAFRRLFRQVDDLIALLREPDYRIVDEAAFRGPLFDHVGQNGLAIYYINRDFCDVVPPCFYGLFRADHAARAKNFFDGYNAEKDIDRVRRDADGRLTVFYDDGSSRETIYCHLQKRRMSVEIAPDTATYEIREQAFTPVADAAHESALTR